MRGPSTSTTVAWLERGTALMAVTGAVARHPGLWPTAVSRGLANAGPQWWRHWPPVPVPAPEWMAFRLECATGQRTGAPAPGDLLSWLEWCRAMSRSGWGRAR